MTAFGALNPSKVLVAGDLHANAWYARRVVQHAAEQGADAILQVGDFLFDGRSHLLDAVQEALEETSLHLAWVDGNHDCHATLQRLVAEHGRTAIPIRSNIHYLPRGYRWTWQGKTFLALGGAHSVDRPWRRPGIEWWAGETISYADASIAASGGKADVMLTHDVPAGVRIPSIEGNPHGFPDAEIYAAEVNRMMLREVVDVVQPSLLLAGHYHVRQSSVLRGEGYSTQVEVLAEDGRALDENTTILNL